MPYIQPLIHFRVVLYDTSQVKGVPPMTVTATRDARAEFRLSESSQVHNSGNSVQFNFNYNVSPSPAQNSSEYQTTSFLVGHTHTQLAGGLVTAGPPTVNQSDSTSPLSAHSNGSVSESPRSSSSAQEQTPPEVQFSFFSAQNYELINPNDV